MWDKTLTGSPAEKTASDLEYLASDPLLEGEIMSLRIKDGEGGGCEIQGCFLELELKKIDENDQMADVYFHADKCRQW